MDKPFTYLVNIIAMKCIKQMTSILVYDNKQVNNYNYTTSHCSQSYLINCFPVFEKSYLKHTQILL